MHDGRTRKVEIPTTDSTPTFLKTHRATLIIIAGPAAGTEFDLNSSRLLIGRSKSADLQIDLPSISSEHAALELDANGFGIRDLASTNGIAVNGAPTLSGDLKHGDRIHLGECELQFVVEERPGSPRAWSVDEDH
ncbi:MAG: FHA domain-containing protein [Deltaproteobacteria bacterium]|nr:FHA domain-containing protein [Deltaproteobacteria bacterium]MBW2723585.1 FHA domain-containing protein [Deltaproteobacteria bacterium]